MTRFKFSLAGMLILVAAVAGVFSWLNYRSEASKPDLSISAADVAWASDLHIWKFDIAEFGDIYGFQLVKIPQGDISRKKMICRIGGRQPYSSSQRLLTVAMQIKDNNISGKVSDGFAISHFKVDDFFQQNSRAWSKEAGLSEEGFIYLTSDSRTIRHGPEPFDSKSNIIALQLFRTPQVD